MIRSLTAAGLALAMMGTAALAQAPKAEAPKAADPANTLVIELKSGIVKVQLRPDLAPKHVERVKTLAKEGFYNGQKFHRVIAGFMAQTGDPTGTGTGGSKYGNLPAEFTPEPFRRGTIGAARTNDPNTANSQFFFCFTDTGCNFLTGKYTVWGQVSEGMEHIDRVARGEPPAQPDVMLKAYMATAAPAAAPAKK